MRRRSLLAIAGGSIFASKTATAECRFSGHNMWFNVEDEVEFRKPINARGMIGNRDSGELRLKVEDVVYDRIELEACSGWRSYSLTADPSPAVFPPGKLKVTAVADFDGEKIERSDDVLVVAPGDRPFSEC